MVVQMDAELVRKHGRVVAKDVPFVRAWDVAPPVIASIHRR